MCAVVYLLDNHRRCGKEEPSVLMNLKGDYREEHKHEGYITNWPSMSMELVVTSCSF